MVSSRTHPVPTTGMRGGLGRTLLTAFLLLAIVPLGLVGYEAFSQVRSDRQRETVVRLVTAAGSCPLFNSWHRCKARRAGRLYFLTAHSGDLVG